VTAKTNRIYNEGRYRCCTCVMEAKTQLTGRSVENRGPITLCMLCVCACVCVKCIVYSYTMMAGETMLWGVGGGVAGRGAG